MGVTGDHPFILGVESNTRRLVSEPARAGQTQVIFQHGLLPDTAVIDVYMCVLFYVVYNTLPTNAYSV
jgi:hypothetical protein